MQAPKTTGPAKDSASHQPNNAVSSEIGQSTSVVNHLALQNPHNAQRGEAGASSADLAASTQTGAMLLDQSEALSRNASNDHVNAILPTNHMNGPTSLWDEAYSEVYQRDKTLMAWFEDFLWSSQTSVRGPTAGNEGKERQIQKLVEEKSMILQENRTRFSCWGHTVVVRDQFMNAIDLMLKFKGIIDVAIQANSAAALAWSGGVVVLQVSFEIELRFLSFEATHNAIHSSSKTFSRTTKKPWTDYRKYQGFWSISRLSSRNSWGIWKSQKESTKNLCISSELKLLSYTRRFTTTRSDSSINTRAASQDTS